MRWCIFVKKGGHKLKTCLTSVTLKNIYRAKLIHETIYKYNYSNTKMYRLYADFMCALKIPK